MQHDTPSRFLARMSAFFAAISGGCGGLSIFAMTALISVDVIGRYVFGKPTLIASEVSGYLLVALVFLGLAYTESQGRHITITILTDRFPRRLQARIAKLNLIVTLLVSAWLTWFTLQPVLQDYTLGSISLTGLRTPMWIPNALIPLGFALFTLECAAKLARELRS